jgi:hypothetical protein
VFDPFILPKSLFSIRSSSFVFVTQIRVCIVLPIRALSGEDQRNIKYVMLPHPFILNTLNTHFLIDR